MAAVVLFLFGFAFSALAAGPEPVKSFDLPASSASDALKTLAAQAERELIFQPSVVQGISTPALKGEFTVREALAKLLAETDLEAVFDDESGAIAIVRRISTSGDPRVTRTEDGELALDAYTVEATKIDGAINRGLLQAGENAPLYHDVVTRTEIERMGVSSLEELFRYLPQTSSLSTVLQGASSNNNTSGGLATSYSTVGLRGFSSAQTVVLVNGRTMPRTGLGDGGGADLSRIPLAAIERVEILPSSGSAIYGAGALGGAINIILRKEYAGRDLTAYVGTSTEGGATEYRFTYLEGMRFNEGRTSLTTTLSYHHRDALRLEDRDYLDKALERYGPDSTATNAQGQLYFEQYILPAYAGAPGTILIGSPAGSPDLGIPGAPGVRFATVPAGTSPEASFLLTPDDFTATAGVANLEPRLGRSVIYTPIDVVSLNAILEHEFVPEKLDGYAELTLGRNERDYTYVQGLNISLDANDPLNPFRNEVTPGFVGRPITLFLDTPDLPDAASHHVYDSARLVAGLKGKFSEKWEWSVDGTLDYMEGTVDSDAPTSNLTELTKLSPFGTPGPQADPATRRAVYPIFADHDMFPISEQTAIDYFQNVRHSINRSVQKEGNARLLGELFDLPAGPVRASLVGKYQAWNFTQGQTYLNADGYSLLINGVPAANEPSSSEASRDIAYGAVELSVPIFGEGWSPVPFIQSWDILASLSREEDSSEGVNSDEEPFVNDQSANSNVIATKIQFTPDIAVRGSYSEGFYPPNWTDVSLPISEFMLPGFFPDPARGNTLQFTPMMTIRQGGNPELEPETAESWNAGLIFTPRFLPDFSLNLDFWRIEKSNAVVFTSFVDIIANPEAFGFLITREEPTADEAAMGWLGRITAVDARAFNASITRTEGADIRLRYLHHAGEVGEFAFNVNATFTNNFDLLATPTAPMVDQAGGGGPVRWRGNAALTWQRNRWSATLTTRYVGRRDGPTTQPSPSYPGAYPIDGDYIPSFIRADVQVSYEQPYATGSKNWFQGTKWTLGVLNVTNEEPTFLTNGSGFYDQADDPRQRFVYVQIKKSL